MADRTTTQLLVDGARAATRLAAHVDHANPTDVTALIAQADATNATLRAALGDATVAPQPSPRRTSAALARLAAARTTRLTQQPTGGTA